MMTIATWISPLIGAAISAVVAVALFRWADRRRAADEEKRQDIALAELKAAVDAIPERMNGKILKALDRHRALCPGATGGTNPRIPRYDSEILT